VSAVNLAFAGVLSHHIADDKIVFNGHRLGFLKTPFFAQAFKIWAANPCQQKRKADTGKAPPTEIEIGSVQGYKNVESVNTAS
jgi:hypothetical protein